MAGITGMGTTFSLPNFVGELHQISPTETPFLTAIGGLTGGREANATIFQWTAEDLRSADPNRQRTEGAATPTAEERVRWPVSNVVEIHMEAVDISYTKQAAVGQFASTGSNQANAVGLTGTNAVTDEITHQIGNQLKQVARDLEKSFLVNAGVDPSSNSTARQTKGIIAATTSNVLDVSTDFNSDAALTMATDTVTHSATTAADGDQLYVKASTVKEIEAGSTYFVVAKSTNAFKLARTKGGAPIVSTGGSLTLRKAAALTSALMIDHLQEVWWNGGISDGETSALLCNGWQKRTLTDEFITKKNYQEMTRNVGGVNLTTFETDFGRLNIMLDRYMPTGMVQTVSLDQCAPRYLPIPGKGHLFVEPVAFAGASSKYQLYGEIGLEYGNEKAHGKVLGLKVGA